MATEETARSFYESARAELIERIGHRDNVLIVYIGAVGAIYGVVLGTTASKDVLLTVPYLALGAALILSQHHAVIGQIAHYLATELHPFFRTLDSGCPPQWETSDAQESYHDKAMNQRFWGHLLLIVVPAVPALLFTKSLASPPWSALGILWWSGLVFTLFSVWVVISVHLLRKRLRAMREAAKGLSLGQTRPNTALEPSAPPRPCAPRLIAKAFTRPPAVR